MMSKDKVSEGLNLTLLRVRIAGNTDGALVTSTPRPGVGLGALAPSGKALAMTNPPVAIHLLEALEIGLEHPAEITLNNDALSTYHVRQLCKLLIRKLTRANIGIYPC